MPRSGPDIMPAIPSTAPAAAPLSQVPDLLGRFGRFGGRYVPETLSAALEQLEAAYAEATRDPARESPGGRGLKARPTIRYGQLGARLQ
jgi:hypothetical protein